MLEDEQGPYVFMNAHRNLIDEGAWTMGGELVARTHHVDRYKWVSGTAYIEVFGIGYLDELLDTVPGLETAARTLALSLMRKGPSVHAKNHNTPLTDCILRHLSDTKLEGRQSPADGRVSSTGA